MHGGGAATVRKPKELNHTNPLANFGPKQLRDLMTEHKPGERPFAVATKRKRRDVLTAERPVARGKAYGCLGRAFLSLF